MLEMNKDGITYLNDPLLHNEKNKYIIRDTLNIYRSLVFPTEFDLKIGFVKHLIL